LLHGDGDWERRGAAFSAKVKDITEFLATNFQPQARPDTERVTYHDACHLAHAQRVTKQPRDLVKAIAGNNFVELPESDVCCGSAGSYNLTEPVMAARLQRRKTENIMKTGAKVVVTSNPGCILQIQAGLDKAAADIRVIHIADYLLENQSSTQTSSALT
jgi:glycolate oxidase iron-sulfur subunit